LISVSKKDAKDETIYEVGRKKRFVEQDRVKWKEEMSWKKDENKIPEKSKFEEISDFMQNLLKDNNWDRFKEYWKTGWSDKKPAKWIEKDTKIGKEPQLLNEKSLKVKKAQPGVNIIHNL